MMFDMDTPTPITPAGWYDDGHGRLRWWDGSRWTEHTAPLVAQQPVPQRPQRPAPPARPVADLVPVKRSKLVWILPLVLVLAALVGGLLGAVSADGISDADPVEDAYARFLVAERTRDCELLEQVTTPGFRDRLVSDPVDGYSCSAWRARPSLRRSEISWAVRIGPFGILNVEERYADPSFGPSTVTYYVVKRDGRWQLDDSDQSGPADDY